ncbi:MAG TPA: M43 family zinc metalloprotease, partial [Chitinophagales bacterium]|nr:M43 family zinc metalloprotease [Chitinophagales bacterium]
MKKHSFILYLVVLLFSISTNLSAQNSEKCASATVLKKQLAVDPKFKLNRDKIEQFTNEYISNQQNGANRNQLATVTIPVVFHVVYNNTDQNVSDTKLTDQIARLNADYSGTNADVSQIPSAFQGVKAGNTNIQFCLAQQDPSGNATTGIIRVPTSVTSFSDDDAVKSSTTGGSNPWNTSKYLNIWVCNLGNSLLGYAQFPGGPSNTDGVVILYSSLPGGTSPYNLGRTATHEVGHWLNLIHVWGDSFCGDDEISDTPTQLFSNSGCPTYPHVTCSNGPNGDMFMNYMDYTNDACMFMFSAGQSVRMNAVVASGGPRASIVTSNGCTPPGPAIPVANFTADVTSACPGSTVSFTDLSSGIPTAWSWSISPATGWSFTGGTTAASQNPKVIFSNTGSYTISLTASNTLGSDGETKTAYITIGNPTGSSLPFSEGFQNATFPPTGWTLNSTSSFAWERTTAAGGFGASSASMYFNNYDDDAAGSKDNIISPVINLNGATTPRLKFDVAYAPYLRSNGTSKFDTLEVLITDYCSNTTSSIYKKGGTQLATASATTNAFVPSAAQWRKDSVSIPAPYLNKNVKITFRNYGLYANNIYVDNVNLYSVSASSPTATASFTASDTVVCLGGTL